MEPGRVCPQNSSRPSASVITSALTVLARALPETNRFRPAWWAAGWRTRTSVASSRPSCPLAPRWATTSASVRSRTPPSTMHSRSPQQRAHLSDGPGDRQAGHPEPAGQYVAGDSVAQVHQGGQQSVDEHEPVSGTGPTARWRGRSASRASLYACQRGPARRPAQPALPGTAAARVRLLDTPRPCPVLNEQAVLLTVHE